MRMVWYLGLVLGLSQPGAGAAPLETLLQDAGLVAVVPSTPAPDFQLFTTTQRPLRLRAQRGKVVILNFWATWCPPCVQEMPMMDRLYLALRGQPFVLWAVNIQESREQVIPFMERHRLHFPALLDQQGVVGMLYMVHSLPMTYVINCSGHLVGQATGVRQWDGDRIHRVFTALLQEPRCRRTTPR